MHAYVEGQRIDQPIEVISFMKNEERQRAVYHSDVFGSVMVVTDSRGDVLLANAYEPFGREVHAAGACGNGRVTFESREQLNEHLLYFRNRVLDVSVGRFTTADQLGFTSGPNVYNFVGNNPLRYVDPHGESFWDGVKEFVKSCICSLGGSDLGDLIGGGTAGAMIGKCLELRGEYATCVLDSGTDPKKTPWSKCAEIKKVMDKVCNAAGDCGAAQL